MELKISRAFLLRFKIEASLMIFFILTYLIPAGLMGQPEYKGASAVIVVMRAIFAAIPP